MSKLRRFTRHIRRFLSRLAGAPKPHTAADQLRADLEKRTSVRTLYPISNACRANGLNNDQRRRVFAEFEALAPLCGMAEARRQAIDTASSYGARKHRRTDTDPWHGPAAA